MTPEFSHALPVARIGPGRHGDRRSRPDAGRGAPSRAGSAWWASRRSPARFRLRPAGAGRIEASGRLRARVVQTSVVSLEPFAAEIAEDFACAFVPAGTETDEIDPETEDELPYEGGVLDLGEAAAEQLALALDPYPRAPGEEVEPAGGGVRAAPVRAACRSAEAELTWRRSGFVACGCTPPLLDGAAHVVARM